MATAAILKMIFSVSQSLYNYPISMKFGMQSHSLIRRILSLEQFYNSNGDMQKVTFKTEKNHERWLIYDIT